MKRILFLLTLCLGVVFTMQAQDAAKADGPQMNFESMEVDYGTIQQGADPYRVFTFVNDGNAPLLITNARGSCGCTVPTYPKGAIPPGEKGEIKVRYDTNRVGPFTKRVTLTTNAGEEPIVLTIKGKVEPKAEAPAGTPEKDNGLFGGGKQ